MLQGGWPGATCKGGIAGLFATESVDGKGVHYGGLDGAAEACAACAVDVLAIVLGCLGSVGGLACFFGRHYQLDVGVFDGEHCLLDILRFIGREVVNRVLDVDDSVFVEVVDALFYYFIIGERVFAFGSTVISSSRPIS